MFLARATIENFRAIRRLEISFDETTVLIGENGSGKTSIFDALHACLGIRGRGPEILFERHHFRPAEGNGLEPVRIVLLFEEREPGEWTPEQRRRFGPVLANVSDGRAAIRWEVRARWDEAQNAARVECRFLDAEGRELGHPAVPDLVHELRRLNPFLIFSADDHRYRPAAGSEAARVDDLLAQPRRTAQDLESLTREIYAKLSESWESLTPAELRKARAAARRIWRRLVHPRRQAPAASNEHHLPSGGAQSLAPLLVFGAILRARGARPLDPDVEPIFGAEHFGAHLHPCTLGSVRYVLETLPVQKVISTYSPELLSALPLRYLRRIVRRHAGTDVYRFDDAGLPPDDLRRLAYHIRARRGGVLFDRCWLLVEGETEFWLLPEMARIMGYEFDAEGVGMVEFAQCGIGPILELARALGISWHLIADGDEAGDHYVGAAREYAAGAEQDHITRLPAADMEHYLWDAGYSRVYLSAAGQSGRRSRRNREASIRRAIRAHSKPFLALSVIEACREAGSPGVPPLIESAIHTAVRLAREN